MKSMQRQTDATVSIMSALTYTLHVLRLRLSRACFAEYTTEERLFQMYLAIQS